jgi:hypothetical protein
MNKLHPVKFCMSCNINVLKFENSDLVLFLSKSFVLSVCLGVYFYSVSFTVGA